MLYIFATLLMVSATGLAQQDDTFPIAPTTGQYELKKQTATKGVSCEKQIQITISPDSVLWINGLQLPVNKAEQTSTSLKFVSGDETIELTRLPKRLKLTHILKKDGASKRADCEYEKIKY